LYPVDLEQVYERQNRPSQRAIIQKAELGTGSATDERVDTFLKAEAYGEPKDPRIITTIPGENKIHYSTYVYAFSASVMQEQHWYAFGKEPSEISGMVAAIAEDARRHIANTDLSRMDGRVYVIPRQMEEMAMLRAFASSEHPRMLELMKTQHHRKAKTPHGVKYDTEWSRLSGSPETADFNSADNAMMNYYGFRLQGLSPEEAYDALGVYGGDDGLTADIDPQCLKQACERVGQVLDISVVTRGETGVNFLSRYYGPDVWNGDANSICDIPRQLIKMHTTVGLTGNITPMMKLQAKALSYFLTDENTPIIGKLAVAVLKYTYGDIDVKLVRESLDTMDLVKVATWWSRYDKADQFQNDVGDWALDYCNKWLPGFDHRLFEDWLQRSEELPLRLLTPPVCVDFDVKHVVKQELVVGGTIIYPEPAILPNESKEEKSAPLPEKSRKLCRDFIAGKCTWKQCKFLHEKA